MFHELIAAANSLSWPGAFALVGCAVALAAVLITAIRSL